MRDVPCSFDVRGEILYVVLERCADPMEVEDVESAVRYRLTEDIRVVVFDCHNLVEACPDFVGFLCRLDDDHPDVVFRVVNAGKKVSAPFRALWLEDQFLS